jgi:hypothetical protein
MKVGMKVVAECSKTIRKDAREKWQRMVMLAESC